jgi:hypothetical protein
LLDSNQQAKDVFWLVVWNTFYFPQMIQSDSYFSGGWLNHQLVFMNFTRKSMGFSPKVVAERKPAFEKILRYLLRSDAVVHEPRGTKQRLGRFFGASQKFKKPGV